MLDAIMFLSGTMVMVLEMVGARLLAPHLGTSVIVWTSLIGVVLASLSAGYWLGGRLADRTLSRRTLSRILAGAALSVLAVALSHGRVVGWVAGGLDSLYLAAVVAAVLLFAVPGVLCGMVSPYVVRLALSDMDTSGAVVGRLYAVSTAGSILGTFLGGMVLVSWFGSTLILHGVAACLLGASLLAHPRAPLARLALLAGVGALAWASHAYAAFAERYYGVRVTETPYNHIRVYDATLAGRPLRLLATDPGRYQSAAYPDDMAELALPYTRFYALGPALVPGARRVLMLGGGGYSVPKWLLSGRAGLNADALRVDVVELDPDMTGVARRHFGLADDARLRIFHEDARAFLNRRAQARAGQGDGGAGAVAASDVGATVGGGEADRYDLIFTDIFNSYYSVPFHVGTVEAARRMRALLADDGAVVMNIISAAGGEDGRLFRAIRAAFAASFADVRVYAVATADSVDYVQNLMLVARPVTGLPETPAAALSPDLREMLTRRLELPTAGAGVARDDVPPLTDEYAPVERYALGLVRWR
ncbi:fused MFS/spermidine synthase [Nitratidesulfovibrio sp.]|uniref:fused MFS/spermidine synthase n=1 Tax=Nitratidesulfovibrio sp. TaxID=2802297 RepID=UPI0033410200